MSVSAQASLAGLGGLGLSYTNTEEEKDIVRNFPKNVKITTNTVGVAPFNEQSFIWLHSVLEKYIDYLALPEK